MEKLKLQDLDLRGKKVLMRVDFNVPLHSDGTIADDTRIRESLPSIRHVLNMGGSLILMSHLGRPKGEQAPEFSLAPCARALSALLNRPVEMVPDCIGSEVEKRAQALQPKEVLLLENLRFYAAEEDPDSDPSFAKKLAQLGDLYVNDAFGTAHRTHTSTATIAQYFPGKAAAGMLMQKEIAFLSSLISHPKRPFYAIIGGAKISTKIGVIHALIPKVDGIFIGGAMAYTFFKAQGIEIGNSLCEETQVETASQLLTECAAKQVPLWLPKDHIIATGINNEALCQMLSVAKGVPEGWQGVDLGPHTIIAWKQQLQQAATVFWNGPLGVFEFKPFSKGTQLIAQTLAHLHATTIIGGGDSVAAINQLGLADKFSHLSTGGGAALEYLELGHLPGIDALSDAL